MTAVNIRHLNTAAADFEAEFQRVLHWSVETDDAIEQRVADILESLEANPFRVRSYRWAARELRSLRGPASDLYAEGGRARLQEIPGVGRALSSAIAEDNVELRAARERGIEVWARQQALAAIAVGSAIASPGSSTSRSAESSRRPARRAITT